MDVEANIHEHLCTSMRIIEMLWRPLRKSLRVNIKQRKSDDYPWMWYENLLNIIQNRLKSPRTSRRSVNTSGHLYNSVGAIKLFGFDAKVREHICNERGKPPTHPHPPTTPQHPTHTTLGVRWVKLVLHALGRRLGLDSDSDKNRENSIVRVMDNKESPCAAPSKIHPLDGGYCHSIVGEKRRQQPQCKCIFSRMFTRMAQHP